MDNLAADFEINPNNPLNAEYELGESASFDCSFELYASGTVWGSIDGDINNQTDLINLLNTKVDLTSFEELSQTVENNYNELTDDISDLTTTVTDNYNTLRGQISDLTTTVNNNYISLDNRLTTAEGSILNLTDTVNDNYTELDGKITNLSGTVSNNYTELNGKITDNTDDITTIQNTINSYGDIVSYNAVYFATANQGALADTALQPNDNISELVNDVGYITSASLPTVNNATITIQKNGSSVGTFTLNQANNATLNITVPTQASDIGAMPDTTTIEDLTTTAQLNALNSGATTTNIGQITTNQNNIADIRDLIPLQASSSNQLADKSFVNSSIATNTAYFIGTFNSVAELEAYSGTLTNNDYAFVATTDSAGNTLYDRYKYNADTQQWIFEYELNNSSFTSQQWASINSGITSGDVTLIGTALQPNDNISELVNDAGYITSASLPTVNNGTLDIQVNGTSVGTFTANQSGNTTANIVVPDSATWGNITGTLSNQTDLQDALNDKQATLVSGTNIKTINNNSILGSGNLTLDGLPSQTGQSGKFLTTDGTDASWATVSIPTVDQTYDGTSANAQSGVAISGAGFLQNTATGIDAITILGNATTQTLGLNIGARSSVTADNGVAIGVLARAGGIGATAIGVGAQATAERAIQIGIGTNGTTKTFSLGFDRSHNYQLLDGTTGLIPDARISSNIARTSAIPTESTVSGWGFTKNTGTVTSVNNIQPVSGNVTITIPTDTSDLTNDAGYITSADLPTNYVTTDTAQDISGRKTFLGEKAIYFKQTATTDKLGFTLYNPSNTELGALEWRPNTINGNALLALNCPQSGSNYVGFRYWSNINIVAPRPTTNGNYFIPVNITDGTNTVTANNNGTLNISSLLPDVSDMATQTWVTNQGYTTNVGTVTSVNNIQPDASGNVTLTIPDTATWGNITGTLSDQTDLQTALDAKQNTISDLSTIRSGASLGATALQPNDNITELVNNAGYITGITSSDVTTALGYTPYDSTNPSGYITSSDLPTVNNGTLTIQKNGTTVGTFTANDTNNVTANIGVPTSISDLTDDTSTYPIDKAESVVDNNSGSLTFWSGTKAQYDAIVTKDVNTLYNVEGIGLYKGNNLISGAMPNSANQSLSNLNSAGQDKFDAKVNKSGDTMTGDLIIQGGQGALQIEANAWGSLIFKNSNIDKTVTPTDNQYMGIDFRDKNDTRIGFLGVRQEANSTNTRVEFQNVGSTDFVFGHSSSVDGQWVYKISHLESGTTYPSGETTHTYSLSDYLPSDNYNYEILVSGRGNVGTTGFLEVFIKSQIFNGSTGNTPIVYRAGNSSSAGGTVLCAIGTNRQLIRIAKCSSKTGNVYLDLLGYRRIGTNS